MTSSNARTARIAAASFFFEGVVKSELHIPTVSAVRPNFAGGGTLHLQEDPATSDHELLGMLVACAAKLSLSSDLHVVRALKMISRLAVLDADETIEVRKRGPGKRVSIKTLLVAVLVYHLHQMMRFKAGQNIMAVSGSPNHIKVSDGLARNIAELPASIIGNKEVWFDVLWMKIFEAYDCQPCLPGCFLTVGLPHDLHQAISEKYKHEFKDLAQKLR